MRTCPRETQVQISFFPGPSPRSAQQKKSLLRSPATFASRHGPDATWLPRLLDESFPCAFNAGVWLCSTKSYTSRAGLWASLPALLQSLILISEKACVLQCVAACCERSPSVSRAGLWASIRALLRLTWVSDGSCLTRVSDFHLQGACVVQLWLQRVAMCCDVWLSMLRAGLWASVRTWLPLLRGPCLASVRDFWIWAVLLLSEARFMPYFSWSRWVCFTWIREKRAIDQLQDRDQRDPPDPGRLAVHIRIINILEDSWTHKKHTCAHTHAHTHTHVHTHTHSHTHTHTHTHSHILSPFISLSLTHTHTHTRTHTHTHTLIKPYLLFSELI